METIKYNKINFYKINDYPGYRVSKCGLIYSEKSNKLLIQYLDKGGYSAVYLYTCMTKRNFCLVHRLVAKAFISNSNNKPQVNHKDFNKSNNNIDNLEWVTNKENSEHLHSSGRMKYISGSDHKQSKKVLQMDFDGNLIKVWGSVGLIKKTLNYNQGNISSVCRGERNNAYGFLWCYI